MDRMSERDLVSRLILQMLKTIEYIYNDNNPRLIIYSDDEMGIDFYSYGEYGSSQVPYLEVKEYYTGKIARDKFLSAVLYSYSHIFRHIADILSMGDKHRKERMFRIIRKAISKIEEEEKKSYERSLLDGKITQFLELRLCEISPPEDEKRR
jgi:hypothetical protein